MLGNETLTVVKIEESMQNYRIIWKFHSYHGYADPQLLTFGPETDGPRAVQWIQKLFPITF